MTSEISAVIKCDEYETLTEEERTCFLKRLEDAHELGISLSERERREAYPDFFQFVESLELDVSQLQEFSLPWGGALSRWLVHYSWTFYSTPADMRDCLSTQILRLINDSEPSTDSSLEDSEQWLSELGKGLAMAANEVMNTTNYVSAMAYHIALDILLGKILMACYRLRLNRLVPR